MIRAKFQLTQITQTTWSGDSRIVRLEARYDPNLPEDQSFAKATPSGHLEMQVDNLKALEELQLGRVFYLDFTPAE